VVSTQASGIERLADPLPGKHMRATVAEVLSDNFALAFAQRPELDLCLCVLGYAELPELPRIVKAIAPRMRQGGTVVGFHMRSLLAPLPSNDTGLILAVSGLTDPVRVHYGGAIRQMRLLAAFERAGGTRGARLVRAADIGLAVLGSVPRALVTWGDATGGKDGDTTPPLLCASVTLEVDVAGEPAASCDLVRPAAARAAVETAPA